MKKYIHGFNQSEVLKVYTEKDGKPDLYLTMDDLAILEYITNMLSSDSCEHIVNKDMVYVWINRTKIVTDLPILRVTEHRVSQILKKLESLELISRITKSQRGSGSKTYISITDITLMLMEDDFRELMLEKFREAKNCTPNISNNLYNINNTNIYKYINNNILLDMQKIAPHKQNTYDNYTLAINEYTEDEELREMLFRYLHLNLNRKDGKKIKSVDYFKGQLRKLDTLKGDKLTIVSNSVTNNWATFVEAYSYSNYSKPKVKQIDKQEIKPFTGEGVCNERF